MHGNEHMQLTVGIHSEPTGMFPDSLKRYEKILGFNNIEAIRLCSSHPNFWEQIKKIDLFIFHWGQWDVQRQVARAILPIVENEFNVPCYPNFQTWWAYDDKIREYLLMSAHGFPMAKTWIFWERQYAEDWARKAKLPVVFKLTGGAGSQNVVLIKDRKKLFKIIRKMFGTGLKDAGIPTRDSLGKNFIQRLIRKLATLKRQILNQSIPIHMKFPNWQVHKNYVLFQEFLPGNPFDTRITVIGKRAFAFRRFNRPNDFRSSGSGKIDYSQNSIDLNFVRKAFEISNFFRFQSMAYDFLYGPDQSIKFCELSYTFIDTAVYKCPGYWDEELNWHEGHFWPQYCVLEDCLKIKLKQPHESEMLF